MIWLKNRSRRFEGSNLLTKGGTEALAHGRPTREVPHEAPAEDLARRGESGRMILAARHVHNRLILERFDQNGNLAILAGKGSGLLEKM